MEIDNYEEAMALKHNLEKAIPFYVSPGKQLLKTIQDSSITEESRLEVSSILYAGDEGGIMVAMFAEEQAFVVSITHIEIDPEHELASAVKEYQTKRNYKCMVKNSKGFSKLAAGKIAKKRKSSKGFS